jgi:beta-alanine degradation protein BauB
MSLIATFAESFSDSPEHWTPDIRAELKARSRDGNVGQNLVHEDDHVRVWTIRLGPGERLPFHCHVLNYFWTALTAGKALSRYGDGTIRLYDYVPGETRHLNFDYGEATVHDLTNFGTTELAFLTVELLDSPNQALPL